jgi:hypothetical protein
MIKIPAALLALAIVAAGVVTLARGQGRGGTRAGAGGGEALALARFGGPPTQPATAEAAELVQPVPLAAVTLPDPDPTEARSVAGAGPSLAGTWSWGAGSAGTITCGALLQQAFPVIGVVSIAATGNDNELLWTDTDEDGTCVLRLLRQGDSARLAPGQSCTSGSARMIPSALTIRRTGAHRLQISGAGAIAAPQFAALGVPCTYQVSATLLLQR